jgi:hypothetical protein
MNYVELFYKICQPKKHNIETDTTKILNPILVLIKLALLSFKPHETKMSIHNHNIYLSPPSLVQGLSRGWYKDSKDDLHHLLLPIYTISLWRNRVPKTISKKQAKKNKINVAQVGITQLPGFDTLILLANNGLLALKRTYEDHVATKHNLDIIIHMLSSSEGYSGIINNYNEELYTKYIWNASELSAILALFNLCQIEPNKKRYYIESIESMLIPIEENIKDIYM